MIGRTRMKSSFLFCLLVLASLAPAWGAQSDAPPAPIRQPAEFEPMQGVMICYPFGVPYDLIAEISENAEVVTVCFDALEQAFIESEYIANNVNMGNCSFFLAAIDSFYSRDWGPWFVIDGNGNQGIIDFDYEWPNSPNDEILPTLYGQSLGIPVYDMPLKTAGGNYMTDGQGQAVATKYIWNNNPGLTHQEIDDILLEYLGIHTHHVMPDPNLWIHIDCCAKFLSPDTIMIADWPEGTPQHDNLEEMATYFENTLTCYGTPFEVHRVFAPHEPYTNSLILNKKVLVPLSGGIYDADAIAAYEEAMPGYEVLGFTHPGWMEWDALHCRTKELTDRYMLYIDHRPLLNRPAVAEGFPIKAEIIAYSGQPFTGGTPVVYWKTTGNWTSVPMTNTGGDHYIAYLPHQPVPEEIKYYIHVEDASGRSENHPYIGRWGAHSFRSMYLGSDISALSVTDGGVVEFFLNAGAAFADRDYYLLASASGSQPGTSLPGGLTLPLNWDILTDFTLLYANQLFFFDFHGTLDASGIASARLDTYGPLPREMAGVTLKFAFLTYKPFDFVSNTMAIQMLP